MAIQKFVIQIPELQLEELARRLKTTIWPQYKESWSWERGSDKTYLNSLLQYWQDQYDWRKEEKALNEFNQFKCEIDGASIHFIHERGTGPNPIPLILTHGWPDSIVRYQKIIPMLTNPTKFGIDSKLSFDVIIPSLPGFGFSTLSDSQECNNSIVADLWAKLMVDELGYDKFVASGGDIGSSVTRFLAANYPDKLIGIHLTDVGIIRDLLSASDQSNLTSDELAYKKDAQVWIAQEGGYMSLQSTKPLTFAYALSDSPIGLAAWIIEKFRSWSDCEGDISKTFTSDELLTNIMLYWFNNTSNTAANIYYENTHSLPTLKKVNVPLGVTIFPKDILLPPRSWVEKNYNVVQWEVMPSGGHFTAMEKPDLFVASLVKFVNSCNVKINE
ncbi:MAG: epoxide hydrolase [Phormidesmis sp. FL-bin-119]|nr:epoxide hydrolase [Pedobacter sp.]